MSLASLRASVSPRAMVMALAALSIWYHVQISSNLGWVSSALSQGTVEDDGSDHLMIEAIKAILLVARLLNLVLVLVGCLGLYGTYKSHLPFIRLFSLAMLLSVVAEFLMLVLLACTAFSASSSALSSSLCDALANADLSLDIGFSLESCEDRIWSASVGLLAAVGSVALVRLGCAFKVLAFYTVQAKKARRQVAQLNLGGGAGRERYSDVQSPVRKRSGSGSAGHSQRIFLLPSGGEGSGGEGGAGLPMVAVTTPSPVGTFPPAPLGEVVKGAAEERYLVYQPVMMTAEEARARGAKEIHHTSRRRSLSYGSGPGTPHTPTAAMPLGSPTILIEEPSASPTKVRLV